MASDAPQPTPITPIPLPTYGQPQPPQLHAQGQGQVQPPEGSTEGTPSIAPTTETSMKDIVMTDAVASASASGGDQAPSPAPAAAPSPLPARTGTPARNLPNGPDSSTSRAASQHPDPAFTMPDAAPAHGAPSRQYLNSKVVPHLLEGMKQLAREQPKDPLRVLGEFLLERAKELEADK